MGTYVISDVHGQLKCFEAILDKINLQSYDRLYVLGDVIDRGTHGIEILKRIMTMPNAEMLLGNHEFMMLNALGEPYDGIHRSLSDSTELWYENGGFRTFVSFQSQSKKVRSDIVPCFVKTKDGTWVIRLSQFENYVKALSDSASSHSFLASSSPPESVVKELRKDLKELAMHNNGYMGSAAPYNRVVAQEDQISKYTDKRHLVQRRKYLVGQIMLNYFPELPPFTGGTNNEYRSKLVRFKQLA